MKCEPLHYRNLQQANRLKNQVDLDSTFGYNFGLGGLGGGTRYNLDPGFRTNLSRGRGGYNRFGSGLGYSSSSRRGGYRGGSDLGYINVLAKVLLEVSYISYLAGVFLIMYPHVSCCNSFFRSVV